MELQRVETAHETRAHLEMRLIHGSYPEVVLMESPEEREAYLKALIASYTGRHAESCFWRTYDRQEIDLVEERGGRLDAVEMKWSPKPGLRAPRAWRQAYPDSSFRVVDRENYLEFITGA